MPNPLTDCLAHLEDERVNNVDVLLKAAGEAGVTHIINAGTAPRRGAHHLPQCDAPRIHHAYGLHPRFIAPDGMDDELTKLKDLVRSTDAVAIGETGLDARDDSPDMEVQKKVFAAQCKLACELELPLIIHCVRAYGPLLEILRQHQPLTGCVHAFGGSIEVMEQLLNMGLCISIGGAVAHEHFVKMREAASKVPLDSLLLESDTPDHPVDSRELSSPAMVRDVLACIATLRGEDENTIAAATVENARQVFRL